MQCALCGKQDNDDDWVYYNAGGEGLYTHASCLEHKRLWKRIIALEKEVKSIRGIRWEHDTDL